MWTGDMQGSYPTQWALNPSAYQNLPNEQVDWATLAQQWIKMKETYPADQVPPAPPPPSIKDDIAAGEAPMDMSKDDVNPNVSTSTSQDGSNWGTWNSWQQWNWGWGGSGTPASTPAMPVDKGAGVPPYTYNTPPNPPSYSTETPGPTTFDYNHGASIPENFDQQGYWSGGPAPFIRNKPEWRSESRGSSSRRQPPKVEEVEPDTTTILDAAKRKQLPAWIREGLEKMEREKQKKLERERQAKERQEEMLRRKIEEEEALASGIPVKSKFDTDSEESEKETEEIGTKPRRSRFDATTSVTVGQKPVTTTSYSPPPPVKLKSREEIMQEVMQQVRYVLTDLLMTVTNDEMQNIAEEVLADFRAKAPATQLRKTPALTSLTGKLGLGIYDSDTNSEDSSEESENEPQSIHENGIDSDEELRERINRKRQEFARIERDIEHQVEEQEEREREREREREQMNHEDEEEPTEDLEDMGQVEPNIMYSGNSLDLETEEPKSTTEPKTPEENSTDNFTPERSNRTEKESSEEQSEEDSESSSSSDSSSSSSSGSRYKKSRKSSKRRKESRTSKRKRKRSSSRGSDRRKSSYRKSSHRYEERHRRDHSRSRSRSHSRGYYDDYHRRKRSPSYHRHSSESSYKRRHHSYSHSPDYSRGKKSSRRSRD